jgi:hypothetical protein
MIMLESFAEWLWYKREKSRIANAFLKDVGKYRQPDKHLEGLARYQERNDWLDLLETVHLTLQARSYDIDLPDPDDLTMWTKGGEKGILTAKGRTYARKLIDDEKNRRFEVKVRWVKLLTPIISSLIGLIGVLIGLVFAIKK